MNTLHIIIILPVIGGLVGFKSHQAEPSACIERETLFYVNYDTVPAKTVYRDLNTGETIDIWYDRVGMRALNKKTGAPVELYVNTSTNDTVFGRGRFIVNNYVIKGADGKWKLNEEKVTLNGNEIKVKTGGKELRIDGDEARGKAKGVKGKAGDDDVKEKTRN